MKLSMIKRMVLCALCVALFCVGAMTSAQIVFRSGAEWPEAGKTYYAYILVLAGLCVCLFAAGILLYNRYVIKRIIRLSGETKEIERGRLQAKITVRGTDELARLASDIDSMRDAMIERMDKEQAALQANSDLIASISHDIRTPLTALIGYLDLVDAGQYSSEEQMKKYIGISRDKAIQLKNLTDELVRYALVFGKKDVQLKLESYDAMIILEQLIGEHTVDMQLRGWRIETRKMDCSCSLKVDALYLKRVFDNLFSNIEKYADPSMPVVVISEFDGDSVHVYFSNSVPASPRAAESTGIGLKTCGKIMEMLGGSMQIRRDKTHFAAELVFPVTFE